MAVPSSSPPPVGTVGVGELLADAQTKAMWLGVPPSVTAAQAVLVGDIVGLVQTDADNLAAANAFTTSGLAGKSNVGHTHAIADISGLTAALVAAGAALPSGCIVLWSSTIGSIPGGWALCNGSNGTPDLRDRFVMGAGGTSGSALAVGGARSRTVTSDLSGAHTPTGAVGYHVLTLAEMAAHAHAVYDPGHVHGVSDPGHFHAQAGQSIAGAGIGISGGNNYAVSTPNTGSKTTGISIAAAGTGIALYNAGSDNGHNHPLTMNAVGGHSHSVTVDITPPYIILGYIMKV